MEYKRITLLCGHYGSGKTNIAVNMAFDLREKYERVALADLDIVNPYFRSKDSAPEFSERGIRLICSEYANSNLDIPALPDDLYAVTDDKGLHVVIDVGGDDAGAVALGRLVPGIIRENDFDMLMVINKFRPLTPDAVSTVGVMREIEAACGLPFTGIINNSNLAEETTAQNVLESIPYANEVAGLSGLPLRATSVAERLYGELCGRAENLFPMKLQHKLLDT